MYKYRKWLPIAGAVLLALGINLDQFGIDLRSFTNGGGGNQVQAESDTRTSSESKGPSDSKSQKTQRHASAGQHWSDTKPAINLRHVFDGEINRKGKPTGFHSRPQGQDPSTARVVKVKDKPNRAGVYTATIEVQDGSKWKSKFSSFFPDDMSRDEVISTILNAYENSNNPNKQPWSGPSGHGFQVQGYTSNRGGINTAFPVYKKSQ